MRNLDPLGVALVAAFLVQGSDTRAQSTLDYVPSARESILDTSFTQLASIGHEPIYVAGGVFVLRSVTIPVGRIVRGVGPNPMIWIVTGDFRVDGILAVDGQDGDAAVTSQSANFPTRGGVGGPAGGEGGDGSPDPAARSFVGQSGYDAYGLPGLGGRGGSIACAMPPSVAGSGGGGGVFTLPGDPYLGVPLAAPQQLGWGGSSLGGPIGGAPGVAAFRDGRPENDFAGIGFDVFQRRIIRGELTGFRGGQGGGGGGDRSVSCLTMDPAFFADAKGGGGGGGGGCLVIYAMGRIIVGPTGRISADGGDGGGGERIGLNSLSGGGGGGSGGLVALAAHGGVELHAHAGTFANGEANFSITADGGINEQSKYALDPSVLVNRTSGGFGGLGIVQISAPLGTNSDGTNTVLDDSIDVIQNGVPLTGAAKQSYLAWRGWPSPNGTPVDDSGNATNVSPGGEGDIRPAPVLLPLF